MKLFLYKFIYSGPVNFLIRNILKSIPNLSAKYRMPPAGILKVKTDEGSFQMATNQTCYVTHLLFWNGYKAFEYSILFSRLISKVNVFYDVGSNIGYYSLLASHLNSKVKVKAFEPASGPSFYLNKNIALNHMKSSITSVDLALSDSTGKTIFHEVKNMKYSYLDHNLSGENNLVGKVAKKSFVECEVTTDTLDNYCQAQNEQPDLIKIDTEGAEIFVLKGGQKTIESSRPIVICEILSAQKGDEILNFFKKMENYITFRLEGSNFKKIVDLEGIDFSKTHDFIFSPSEKTNLFS